MSNASKGQTQLPDGFRSGEALKADDLERMRRAIAFALKDMIGGGRGITVSQSAGKYLISARKQRGGGVSKFPLKPHRSGANKVKFTWGTVNGYTPTIDEVEITADLDDPANPEITISESGIIYVKVDVAEGAFAIDNPVLEFATSVPADTTTAAHRAIVNVAWDSESSSISSIAPSHRGSIEVASCGGVVYYWDLGQTNDITYNYYEGYY